MTHLNKVLTKEFLLKKLIGERIPIMELAVDLQISKHSIIDYCKKHKIYDNVKQYRVLSNGITEDFTGKQFSKLTVISLANNDAHGKTRWLCRCECGKEKLINSASLKRGLTKSCGFCCKLHNFKGYKDISGVFWRRTKEHASKRGLVFDITPEYIWSLYEKQNKKCSMSGVDICFVSNNDKGSTQTASIDRIDSTKGYITDNIQLVHKRINFLKGSLTNDELIFLCRCVVKHNKKIQIDITIEDMIKQRNSWS